MAANEGEQRLLTYFADVHYYFSAPTPRPTAHRFDKGSYLYLYGNKSGNGARLEIANNVGKPEQDAVTGTMDSTIVSQSFKHPTLCTVIVDGYDSQPEEPGPIPQPEHHWRLPNTDPRNEGKYMFRLHTLDIYFWKAEDAHAFVAAAKNKLEPLQLEVLDAPPNQSSHKQLMSPVVQQLENVAIRDPAYRNGQTRNSRTTSTSVTRTHVDSESHHAARQGTPEAPPPASFQPLAYNPAAPAAPEPIKHREKTPPPVDAEEGTGLAGAAYRDHAQSMSPQASLSRPHGQPQNIPGFVSPQPPNSHASPLASQTPSAAYTGSLSPNQGQRASSISSIPPPPPKSGRGSVSPYTPTPLFAPPPQSPQSAASQHSEQIAPAFSAPPQDLSQSPFYRQGSNPPESPATEILGNSYVSGVRQPLQHLQPQYASYTPSPHAQEPERVGGYSNYQYEQQQPHKHHHYQHPNPQSNEYDVHSQVYRPTPEEASKHKPLKASTAAPGSPAGRLEQGAGKVDKRVNSLFKRLEKKIG